MIRKILTYLSFINKIKFEFKINKRPFLLIGSESDTYLFKQYISRDVQVTQYPVKLNFFILILTFFKKKKSKKLLQNYMINYIEYCDPKMIINFIDNHMNFYEFKNYFSKKKFIVIQNGYRGGPKDIFYYIKKIPNQTQWKCDYLLTFNDVIGNEFKKYIDCKTLTIGSFRNNFFQNFNNYKKNSLAFISTYEFKNEYSIFYQKGEKKIYFRDFYKAEEIIIKFLKKYCEKNDLFFSIILKTNDQREKNFYNNIVNGNLNFFDRSDKYSSYDYLEKVNYFVGTESTMTYEALSKKKRIAALTIRENLLKDLTGVKLEGLSFCWPGKLDHEGKFWTHFPNSNSFSKVLDFVVKSSDDEWNLELNKMNKDFKVHYDKNNFILNNLIKEYID